MNLESLVKMAIQQFGGSSAPMVGGILQMLLQRFLNQGEGGFTGFLDMFRQAGLGDLVNGWFGGGATAPLSEAQVKSALGGGGLLTKLGSLPGVSASTLLPMLGFLIPKLVGVLTPGGHMPTPAGLMQQMESLAKMPALPSMSGLSSMAAPALPEVQESASKWIIPLIAGLALIGAILFFTRGGGADAAAEGAKTAVAETKAAVTETAGALGAFLNRKLPSGIELNVPELGIESKVIAFIEDGSKPVDKTTWFDFDRLLFDTGKATLQPTSQEQLKNIAAIMAAYPKVKIKIGGYTDNVGAKEANMKLSSDRAANVMAELKTLGVAADRMESEGYGDEHPVGDNNTEEGRAQNRRIALRVTEK